MGTLRITALLLTLMLLAVTLGLAVPSINVGVRGLGGGSNVVVGPVGDGRYTIWASGGTVTDVELILGGNLPGGTRVYVVLRDSSGNNVSNGSLTVGSGGIAAGTPFNVSVSPVDTSNVDPTKTEVVILSSEYNSDSSGPIFVSVQKMGVGSYDGRYSNPITIHGSTVYLDYYPVRILLVSSDPSFPWNSLYFTNSTGRCLYYWKEFQGTFVYENGATYSWAVFWVNVTNIPPNSDETIFVNYLGSGNPCASHQDPNKVFLFYDAFNSLSNWEVRGTPQVLGGYLSLNGGDWVWTRQSFQPPYAVEMLVNLTYDDGTVYDSSGLTGYSLGPFILPYVTSGGDGAGEGIGRRYLWVFPVNQEDGEVNFNVYSSISTLSWSYRRSDSPYVMNLWEVLNTTVYSNALDFSQVLFITNQTGTWALSSDPSTGVPAAVYDTSSYSVSLASAGHVGIGQWSGGPTRIDFLFVRKYVYPEPTYEVGRWYYHLTFTPTPSLTSNSINGLSLKTPSVNNAGKAIETNVRSSTIWTPRDETSDVAGLPVIESLNISGVKIKELLDSTQP